jgi:hypothetical protein
VTERRDGPAPFQDDRRRDRRDEEELGRYPTASVRYTAKKTSVAR